MNRARLTDEQKVAGRLQAGRIIMVMISGMSGGTPKRLWLEADDYRQLRVQVLECDGWRCQQYGRRTQLEVHHTHRRSRGGDDRETKLLTLCRVCHRGAHQAG